MSIKNKINSWIRKFQGFETDKYELSQFYYYRTIFIHIPKTAGISISRSLFGNLSGGHKKITDYQKIFTEDQFDQFFKFTVVRNPWTRCRSAYQFLKRGGINATDKAWSQLHLSDITSFRMFVMEWLNEDNIWKGLHFHPQSDFLKDNEGKIKVDFVGRFENLEKDYYKISRNIGLKNSLKVYNKTSQTNANNISYTKEMIDKVKNIYEEDVVKWDYKFFG
jgi:hypothetical protein